MGKPDLKITVLAALLFCLSLPGCGGSKSSSSSGEAEPIDSSTTSATEAVELKSDTMTLSISAGSFDEDLEVKLYENMVTAPANVVALVNPLTITFSKSVSSNKDMNLVITIPRRLSESQASAISDTSDSFMVVPMLQSNSDASDDIENIDDIDPESTVVTSDLDSAEWLPAYGTLDSEGYTYTLPLSASVKQMSVFLALKQNVRVMHLPEAASALSANLGVAGQKTTSTPGWSEEDWLLVCMIDDEALRESLCQFDTASVQDAFWGKVLAYLKQHSTTYDKTWGLTQANLRLETPEALSKKIKFSSDYAVSFEEGSFYSGFEIEDSKSYHIAHLVDQMKMYEDTGEEGPAFAGRYSPVSEVIAIHEYLSERVDLETSSTVAHELFHAIQLAHIKEFEELNWFIESSAKHIGQKMASQSNITSGSNRRPWNFSLDKKSLKYFTADLWDFADLNVETEDPSFIIKMLIAAQSYDFIGTNHYMMINQAFTESTGETLYDFMLNDFFPRRNADDLDYEYCGTISYIDETAYTLDASTYPMSSFCRLFMIGDLIENYESADITLVPADSNANLHLVVNDVVQDGYTATVNATVFHLQVVDLDPERANTDLSPWSLQIDVTEGDDDEEAPVVDDSPVPVCPYERYITCTAGGCGVYFIRSGTLDDPVWVTLHIWCLDAMVNSSDPYCQYLHSSGDKAVDSDTCPELIDLTLTNDVPNDSGESIEISIDVLPESQDCQDAINRHCP